MYTYSNIYFADNSLFASLGIASLFMKVWSAIDGDEDMYCFIICYL